MIFSLRTLLTKIILVSSMTLLAQENFTSLSQVRHGILTNDVWGYVDPNGIEYAIVGTRNDARIYELSNPNEPRLIAQIPGSSSIWRDFKNFGPYIYQTTDQGTDGLRIIDMRFAPDSVGTKLWHNRVVVRNDTINMPTCHNLWIDTTQGLAYLAGCRVSAGGAVILDLKEDPLNPVQVGLLDERYAHDIISQGDLLFASEIYEGNLGIYDANDKSDIRLLSRSQTSSSFTHNAWPSDDGRYIFTTDERAESFVDAFDISDPRNPVFLDKYKPVTGRGVIPHNAHFYNGYLVVSWYTEGVVILDVHRPDNMVKVAQFDTDPNDADGCWGAYPFLPSGIVLASDITTGFWVLKPNYQRAAYLSGTIRSNEGNPINGATIELMNLTQQPLVENEISDGQGTFKTGVAVDDSIMVKVSHPEYQTFLTKILPIRGEEVVLQIELVRLPSLILRGVVRDTRGAPISNVSIAIQSERLNTSVKSNALGVYEVSLFAEDITLMVAAWGFKGLQTQINITNNTTVNLELEEGYEDDFFADLGWKVNSTATSGFWTRAIPALTTLNGSAANPGTDVIYDIGLHCYVTGNDNRSVGFDDVDDGITTLVSPTIILNEMSQPIIYLSAWFFNGGGNGPGDDALHIAITNDIDTVTTHVLTSSNGMNGGWRDSLSIDIYSLLPNSSNIKLIITASDLPGNGHIVEAGIDHFSVIDADRTTSLNNTEEAASLVMYPNPTKEILYLDQHLNNAAISIFNEKGALVSSCQSCKEIGVGHLAPAGYIVQIIQGSDVIVRKMIKI